MKYYLALPLLLLFFLQSCQDEDAPTNQLEFYWDQTGCSDPWNTNSNDADEETMQAVADYLLDQGVKGARVISITGDGVEQGCEACFCTNGNRINIIIPTNQKDKMIELGFSESN
ncbi:hypothetical protein SAMN04489724_1008 [Algoriphagus locisalis]|uniref:Uncharacterized protein n=1 Tax=Algoriphagus locisalis TaxID=305507 RepID=A0A1I6YHL3_9BACT|nr:hypothetical protein [Algoriphagus locisalis]SFT49821.1 hypothetical protein SAMN04489724_1008 [Algoriphagus locisalis]